MISSGEIRDWAEAARLAGVTRARMTQIANLLLLAPKIQEGILNLSNVTEGPDPVTEQAIREVAAKADWQSQTVSCMKPQQWPNVTDCHVSRLNDLRIKPFE